MSRIITKNDLSSDVASIVCLTLPFNSNGEDIVRAQSLGQSYDGVWAELTIETAVFVTRPDLGKG